MEITVRPRVLVEEIILCISKGLTPYITSSPGMGKSSIVTQIAKRGKLKLIDLRVAQMSPEDLQGYPFDAGQKAEFKPFDVFPVAGDDVPAGYDGWLIFLDELSSANKQVQAASYKLILDRMVGSLHLHEKVCIVAAGNKATDKAVVVQMSTALQSRLIHYELEMPVSDWTEYAVSKGLDHRVVGYVNYAPSKLMDFNPDP